MAREPRPAALSAARDDATIGNTAPAQERVAPAALVEGTDGTTAVAGSLGEAAAALGAPVVPVEVPGPGVGAERIAQSVTRVEDRPVLHGDAADRVLPATPVATIDPATVPGHRWLRVATQVTHDGKDYSPDHTHPEGRGFYADFKTYSELVAIGAVLPRNWPELDDDD